MRVAQVPHRGHATSWHLAASLAEQVSVWHVYLLDDPKAASLHEKEDVPRPFNRHITRMECGDQSVSRVFNRVERRDVETALAGEAVQQILAIRRGAESAQQRRDQRFALARGNDVGKWRERLGIHKGDGAADHDQRIAMRALLGAQRNAREPQQRQHVHRRRLPLVGDVALVGDADAEDRRLEHRLRDLPAPEHLYQVQAEGLREEFPALRSVEARPNNLPTPLTTFVGRGREIAAVKAAVEEARLVTLTGPGGTGKTRLSVQTARELLPVFEDGAFFVPLASITDPALVVPTIGDEPNLASVAARIVRATPQQASLLIAVDNSHVATDRVVQTEEEAVPVGEAGRTAQSTAPITEPDE